jgi:Mg2+ and Co2+ transporter CorA
MLRLQVCRNVDCLSNAASMQRIEKHFGIHIAFRSDIGLSEQSDSINNSGSAWVDDGK